MRICFILFTFLFIVNIALTQERKPSKVIQTTEKKWSVDEFPEPNETLISFYDEKGNVVKSEEYILDSLVIINLATFDSLNKETSYTRLKADSSVISSVRWIYKPKGKRKTKILIVDENNEIFSKEFEVRNELNQVVLYKINYVQEKLKSVIHYEYDSLGREISYKSYDGKRLDFFIIHEYNAQGFSAIERMGLVPYGDDNLVYNFEYPKVDEHGSWTERLQFVEEELSEKTTRIISYY
jgi:hypothetical protein